jgi:hypothetical protein
MVVAKPTSRPAPVSKSVPVHELCVLCASVFSSPNLFAFHFKLLALSVVEGSTFHCFSPKSRRIRTYAKQPPNPFTICTSKTKHLKSFRIRTSKKTGEGDPLVVKRTRDEASLCRGASRRSKIPALSEGTSPIVARLLRNIVTSLHRFSTNSKGGRTTANPPIIWRPNFPPSTFNCRLSTLPLGTHPKEARQRSFAKNAKMISYPGGDSVSTEAVAARRHAGTHLPVTWWKLEMPTTTWHLLLN